MFFVICVTLVIEQMATSMIVALFPVVSEWPLLGKSVTIMRSLRNSLNNRFTPFAEIVTEAVLTMDDDLDMLTSDELEFGFHIWAHHSDRLVGIPSRLHYRDNVTGAWRYDSEWKSELSMVLTGAAFYHKVRPLL